MNMHAGFEPTPAFSCQERPALYKTSPVVFSLHVRSAASGDDLHKTWGQSCKFHDQTCCCVSTQTVINAKSWPGWGDRTQRTHLRTSSACRQGAPPGIR